MGRQERELRQRAAREFQTAAEELEALSVALRGESFRQLPLLRLETLYNVGLRYSDASVLYMRSFSALYGAEGTVTPGGDTERMLLRGMVALERAGEVMFEAARLETREVEKAGAYGMALSSYAGASQVLPDYDTPAIIRERGEAERGHAAVIEHMLIEQMRP